MAVDGKLKKISPYESLRRLKSLLNSGAVWAPHNIILVIADNDIIIRDGRTRVRQCMPITSYSFLRFLQFFLHVHIDITCGSENSNDVLLLPLFGSICEPILLYIIC